MIPLGYVASVSCRSDLVDPGSLGNGARSIITLGLREGIDAVGPSKIDRRVVEKHLDYC